MASAEVMSSRLLKRKQVSKPSDKRESTYKKVIKNLKKIGFTRYDDELVPFLSSMNPDREKKKVADEIVDTPGAADALERIMLEDNDLDVAAAVFTSLLRDKDGIDLTEKQEVLFKLLLKYHDVLSYDLEKMGNTGGSVLIDILFTAKTEYSKLSTAYIMNRAEFSQEDMLRLYIHMGEMEDSVLKNQLYFICGNQSQSAE